MPRLTPVNAPPTTTMTSAQRLPSARGYQALWDHLSVLPGRASKMSPAGVSPVVDVYVQRLVSVTKAFVWKRSRTAQDHELRLSQPSPEAHVEERRP